MITKAIIIGASTVGKTTLLNYVKQHIQLPVTESDDELTTLNGGTYPSEYVYKLTVLAPKMVEDILQRDESIFFTNVDYFTPQNLNVARQKGFTIIQLMLPRELMEIRNKHRIEHENYDDLSTHFDRMEEYQKDIFEQNLIDKRIFTDKPIENVAQELLSYLSSPTT